jgi:nucleotidyltransferase/DNA polymerase involved in DNA repair
MSHRLSSSFAACVWIPLFPLRCEEARHEGLAAFPTALLAPDTTRKLWQISSLARHAGVKPGMTVSQAIGLCPTLRLIEPDPVHYDEQFAALLSALSEVSPIVEQSELGLAYVGVDGLEGIYGSPQKIIAAIHQAVGPAGRPVIRMGWGVGKFTAWVAASRAKPSEAIVVPAGTEQKFLASQPIAVLPLDPNTHRRLRQLGIRTLGALAALPEAAVTAQFGAAGKQLWRLAAGRIAEAVEGRVAPEPIALALTFFTPVGERELLAHSLDQLIARALKHPRRIGWRVHALRLRADLESGLMVGNDVGGNDLDASDQSSTDSHSSTNSRPTTNRSWLVNVLLKDPTADAARIAAPLKTRLEQSPPTGGVERLVLEFTAFAPGSTELQLFARDAQAAARAGQQRALRHAAREVRMRIKGGRANLYHVIEVQPWSRLPERRYALIDYEP